jgi:hypothetical protein
LKESQLIHARATQKVHPERIPLFWRELWLVAKKYAGFAGRERPTARVGDIGIPAQKEVSLPEKVKRRSSPANIPR